MKPSHGFFAHTHPLQMPPARLAVRPLAQPSLSRGRPGGRVNLFLRRRAPPPTTLPAAASTNPALLTSSRQTVRLPDGGTLEVLSATAAPSASTARRPPLLFIHGSAHAAWCWTEHWQQWFAERGHASHAVSLRGRGGSGPPPPGAKAGGTLASHAADIAAVVAAGYGLKDPQGKGPPPLPPILVGHSFGGLVAQRLAAEPAATAPLSGLILAASVPPSGNGAMIKRIAAERGLWASALMTADFIFKTYRKSPRAARRLFFSDAMPEDEVERLMAVLASQDGDTPVIDVRAINSELPVRPPGRPFMPALVLGGAADKIVDLGGLQESADAVGAGAPVVLEGLAHDLMLDVGWVAAAEVVEAWLCGQRTFCKS